jgi:hypothetical protein
VFYFSFNIGLDLVIHGNRATELFSPNGALSSNQSNGVYAAMPHQVSVYTVQSKEHFDGIAPREVSPIETKARVSYRSVFLTVP